MGRRSKAGYSIADIARVSGAPYREVLRDEKAQKFIYRDLGSMAFYIVRKKYDISRRKNQNGSQGQKQSGDVAPRSAAAMRPQNEEQDQEV